MTHEANERDLESGFLSTTGGFAGPHPPYLYPGYDSTRLRAPKRPLTIAPHTLSELSGPVYGHERIGELDHDLTRQHAGEPLGERIIVTGRVLDGDGRPVRDSLIELWQANSAGRYTHAADRHPAPLDPNFSGAGRCGHRLRRALPLRHGKARGVSVGQPSQRLATRPRTLFAVRAVV